jgi:hypothetical protein
MELSEAEEEAYNYSLGQEMAEWEQEAGFGNAKWTIIKLMQTWGIPIDFKGYCFLKEALRFRQA